MKKCFAELQIFSNNLRKTRFEHNLSIEKLAEMIDCHPNAIGRIERGQSYPSFSMIILLTRALKISSNDLMPK